MNVTEKEIKPKGLVIRYFENAYFLCNGKPPNGCENDGHLYIGEAVKWFCTHKEASAMKQMIDSAYGFVIEVAEETRFYGAVEDNGTFKRSWTFLYAKNITAAKREASRLFGKYKARHCVVVGAFKGFTRPANPLMEINIVARRQITGTWT